MKGVIGMLKRVISIIITTALVIGMLPFVGEYKTKAANTYYIYTIEDLYNVRNDNKGTYYLMNDIDLGEATSEGGDYNYQGKGWNAMSGFNGLFYGQGNAIKNINMLSSSSFFGNLGGKIYDLEISGTIDSTASNVGSFASVAGLTSVIENCVSNVSITRSTTTTVSNVGGIAGYANGLIQYCKNINNVKVVYNGINAQSLNTVGGIAGQCAGGIIRESYNTGNVTAGYSTYGAGIANNIKSSELSGSIYNCYNTGGIYGVNSSTSRSYVSSLSRVGDNSKCLLSCCYNVGVVEGYERSYDAVSGNQYLYYNAQGYKRTCTESQMRLKSSSMYVGFDFDNVWILDDVYLNYKYPQLRQNMQDNTKTISSVELISSIDKTRYYQNDVLDLTGGAIKIYYSDGSSKVKDIDESMLRYSYDSPYYETKKTGSKSLVIYADKENYPDAKCVFIDIEVVERPNATMMTLISEPTKKEFIQNTTFDFSGCQVQIAYDNGDIEVKDITADMTTGGNIARAGTQTIYYSMGSLRVQFVVDVIPLSVSFIKVETKPNKLSYIEGNDFDPTGMTVRAYLNDGSDRLVDDYTYSGYSSEPGTHTITVEYSGCTDTFDVVVNEKTPTSIKVAKNPTKTTYIQGQEVDPEGMEVTAYYNNGTNGVIDGYTIDKPTMDTGVQTVAVRYGDLVTYIPITVIARQATGLFVTSVPNKTTYIEGTEFDDTGLVVAASFNDGVTESIDDYELAGVDTSTVGNKIITVMYQGFTATFDINVIAKSLESIRITDKGKDSYLVGEELDTSNLVVEACYDNGTYETITNYEVSGFTGDVGDNVITVSYQGKNINYVVKVHEPDDEWTITKEATCTEKGERVKYCKHCGEVAIKEDIDKLGHTSVPDLAKDATCTETGLTAGSHCDTCGEILVAQEVIPAKGHTPSEDWEMIKDSTCLDEGSQVRRCATCHEIVDTNVIAAKGHKLVTDEAVAATCTESGLTEGLHCEVCDEIIQAQTIVQPLGHVEAEEWTVTKSPTCTVAGTKVKKCTVCGHILKTEIIDPTGHSFKNYVSNNDATCTEDGTKTAKCEHCSETKTITDVNSAKGHKVVYDKVVAATCTESGLTAGSHCSECHEILQKQEVVAPKGHTESSRWTVSKEPTCTEKGVEVCKCVECDEVLDSRKIEAKGHTEVVDGAIEATCIDTGLTEGKHCHVCGEVLVAQKVIPAKGHHEVVDKKVDATCEKTGLTQGSHCDVCSEILEKQEVIPAKGHSAELKHVSQATYFDQGYTGDEVCNVCGQVLKRGETINKLQVPKPIVKFKKGKKKIILKTTKQNNISKYEIRIKKGKKWKVYYTNKNSFTIKKLKKKKKYTIKIRAIIVRGGRNAYSNYITKKIKTK